MKEDINKLGKKLNEVSSHIGKIFSEMPSFEKVSVESTISAGQINEAIKIEEQENPIYSIKNSIEEYIKKSDLIIELHKKTLDEQIKANEDQSLELKKSKNFNIWMMIIALISFVGATIFGVLSLIG